MIVAQVLLELLRVLVGISAAYDRLSVSSPDDRSISHAGISWYPCQYLSGIRLRFRVLIRWYEHRDQGGHVLIC